VYLAATWMSLSFGYFVLRDKLFKLLRYSSTPVGPRTYIFCLLRQRYQNHTRFALPPARPLNMSVRAGSVRIACRTRCRVPVPVADLPVFLCPGLIAAPRAPHQRRQLHSTPGRAVLAISTTSQLPKRIESSSQGASITKLPLQCPGCGALSQTIDKDAPGYYNLKRRSVSAYLKGEPTSRESEEDSIIEKSLRAAAENDPSLSSQLNLFTSTHRPSKKSTSTFPQ
jgi:hypothetical protein